MKHPIRATFTARARLRSMIVGGLAAFVFAAIAAPGLAGGPTVGAEFQVNSYTTGMQHQTSVAMAADGTFVVVWNSGKSAGSDTSSSVQCRRFSSDGLPSGVDFQVNTYTTSYQAAPSIGVASDGSFVVVWESAGSSGSDISDGSIQAQRFTADATPLGAEFQVNAYTSVGQFVPVVGVASDGTFVVVWESGGSAGLDSSGYSIQGQRFTAAGGAVEGQFEVNSYTTDDQNYPALAVSADGGFVVVWKASQYSAPTRIEGQRYDSDGVRVGSEFQVNISTAGGWSRPGAAFAPDGGFVVVWEALDGIQGRRYSSDGVALGDEFVVNSYTSGTQDQPSVATDSDGEFVVSWRSPISTGSDTSWTSIHGRRFASAGGPIGGEFQVNSFTPEKQYDPSVGMAADGRFVVVWSNSSGAILRGQRFATEVFTDGFESGGTTAWSATVGGP